MNNFNLDPHIIILVVIMLVSGAFGGFLNYLHNFDTIENEKQSSVVRNKYILLGIAAAFVIPVFLKMISSNLISSSDNNDYLIFAGFCLIAAIFSRRFITTIGDNILEAAKKAEKVALESKLKSDNTQRELSSTNQRIEDVKLAVDINNTDSRSLGIVDDKSQQLLLELSDNYIEKTSVPDYSERIKLKAELGRKMGEIIVRNNLSKTDLFDNHKSEGMFLALSYSVQLRPDKSGLNILNQIAKLASQLYTKHSILVAYDTLARNSFIDKQNVQEVYSMIKAFRNGADKPLQKKIDDTERLLNFIDPIVPE